MEEDKVEEKTVNEKYPSKYKVPDLNLSNIKLRLKCSVNVRKKLRFDKLDPNGDTNQICSIMQLKTLHKWGCCSQSWTHFDG